MRSGVEPLGAYYALDLGRELWLKAGSERRGKSSDPGREVRALEANKGGLPAVMAGPWIESSVVALIALGAFLLGRWCSRLPIHIGYSAISCRSDCYCSIAPRRWTRA